MNKYYVCFCYVNEFKLVAFGSLDWDADSMNRETLEAVLEYIRNMGTRQPVVVSWNKYE